MKYDPIDIRAALQEALRRYPDQHAALVFFWGASGLAEVEPASEHMKWAEENTPE